jgi:transposase
VDTFMTALCRRRCALKKHHRRHDIQFKWQAVRLANHPEIRTQDVAAALGIHPFMLSRWKKEMRDGKLVMDKPLKHRRAATLSEADERIRELERENAQLREENDLLKKLEPSGLQRRRKSSRSLRSTGGGSK